MKMKIKKTAKSNLHEKEIFKPSKIREKST